MTSIMFAAAVAALALIPTISAHGYVSSIVAGGQTYDGANPNWQYASTKPSTPGWFANNQDNGFVAPDSYTSGDIICHKGATPGTTSVTVNAGDSVKLVWNTWPESHHGPVIDYLASCNGACSSVSKTNLDFYKIDQGGLVSGSNTGTWATDTLIKNGNSWTVKIPSNTPSGEYVLRHEIIGLHSAGNANGAQNYPQCVNIKVTGSSSAQACSSGAACVKGTSLYTATDKGILFNLYTSFSSYPIPGPALWSGLKKRHARDTSA